MDSELLFSVTAIGAGVAVIGIGLVPLRGESRLRHALRTLVTSTEGPVDVPPSDADER